MTAIKKLTRAKRKELKYTQAIADARKLRSDLAIVKAQLNECEKSGERIHKSLNAIKIQLDEYKRWENDVKRIVGKSSISLKEMDSMAVNQLPEYLQLSLPHDVEFLIQDAREPSMSCYLHSILAHKLEILSRYDVFNQAMAISARIKNAESAIYFSDQALFQIPKDCLIRNLSLQVALHLEEALSKKGLRKISED